MIPMRDRALRDQRRRRRMAVTRCCADVTGVACCLPGCASTRRRRRARPAAPQREPVLLTRDYVAEILRYLYRWHADETLLASVSQYSDTELWARPLHPQLDAGDDSRFCEVLFPRVHMRIVLKQADYLVEELGPARPQRVVQGALGGRVRFAAGRAQRVHGLPIRSRRTLRLSLPHAQRPGVPG